MGSALYPDFRNPDTDWETTPVRGFLRLEKEEVGERWADTQLLSLTKQGVIDRDIDSGVGKYPASFEGYQYVEPGDLIFCLFDVEETPRTVGLVKSRGMITSAYTRARLDLTRINPRYAEYLFLALDDEKRFRPFYNGLRNTIQKETFRSTRLSIPPIEEQRRIADFLDRETAKIDALIAKQEQLITTLDKRRQAVISKFVSKGSNPDAPMTQDSVNVLGPAPRHWTVKRLKYSIVTSKNGVWGEEPRGDESDFWCVRIADFDRPSRSVKPFPRTVRSVTMPERFGRTLARGDLIIEKSGGGDQAPVGCVVMYDYEEPAVCSNFAARLSIANGNSSKYWTYAHAALYFHGVPWKSIKQTSGIQNLDLSSYLNEVVAFPPLPEQLEIAEHLDEVTRDIDLLVEKSVATTSVLKERRQALISAAVTGKLEVGV